MKYVIPHLVRDEFTRISRNISKRISSSIIGEYKILAGNIEYNFRKAITQSKYIIFDLRHVKMPEQQCIAQLETEFSKRPYLKKLFIIKKTGKLLTYPQK